MKVIILLISLLRLMSSLLGRKIVSVALSIFIGRKSISESFVIEKRRELDCDLFAEVGASKRWI